MLGHYLKTTLRLLERRKLYSFINIFGLAVGLAACIVVLAYVRHELRYDRDLPNADQIYQVQTYYVDENPEEERSLQTAAYVMREFLRKDFPQILDIVFVLPAPSVLLKDGHPSTIESMIFVDGPFFDMFHYPFLHGNPASALSEPGSLVLTESEAHRQFGRADVVGRTVDIVTDGTVRTHRITGVVRDLPQNSHLRLSMMARFDPQSFFADQPDFFTNWWRQSGWMYVRLQEGAVAADINSAFPAWERRNIPSEQSGGSSYNAGDDADFGLVNIRDIHLGPAQLGAMTPGNDKSTLVALAALAFTILAIACFNFINLSTALATRRAREIGVRKVVGATRRQLVAQFIGESLFLSLISLLFALTIVELTLRPWSSLMGVSLAVDWTEWETAAAIGVLLAMTGIAGGAYPALYLSQTDPSRVLRTSQSPIAASGGALRHVLVVAQFGVAIALIVCTSVVYAQTIYARDIDPGFERANLFQVGNLSLPQVAPIADTLAREVVNIPGVIGVARTTVSLRMPYNRNTRVRVPGRRAPVAVESHAVDARYFDTMGIDLVAGRQFAENRTIDEARLALDDASAQRALVARGMNILVNEAAVRHLGFSGPEQAVGQRVQAALVEEENGRNVPATIIGVVEDSRFNSVREPVKPALFRLDPQGTRQMVVRFRAGREEAVRQRIEAFWSRLLPDVPFEAGLADDLVYELYRGDEISGKLFGIAALLSITLACLGLLGLAAFTAERRTKEIGIRKVFGARTRDIVGLLAWQFSKPVIVANFIAWPIAWWVMREWLNKFDARIDLGPAPFLLAGLLALAIAV